MHILNVNSFLDFKTGGGTAERTFQMSHYLANEHVGCTILTIDTGLDEDRKQGAKPAEVVVLPLLWRRFFIPKVTWDVIINQVEKADIIHFMGHWGVLNALVYIAARRAEKPYVVCPAGALPIFGRSKWLKRLYNFAIGEKIIRNASGWIAVTSAEFPHFESYSIPRSRVTIIPNGISQEDFPVVDSQAFRQQKDLTDAPIILFMGRLNPIKGPDILLQAFVLSKERLPDYQLVFAGPDEGMQASLMAYADEHGVAERVHFIGFVSGRDKSAAYRMASLLVVPSRQEAMSIVALEAMVCGTPVLLTDQCGFNEIASISSNLEVPVDAEKIAGRLVELLANKQSLEDIASSLKDFAISNYSWNQVILNFLNLYKKILKEQ